MITVRKHIHFKCAWCGHEAWHALRVAETQEKNTYVCERCQAISKPKNYLLVNFGFGVIIGSIVGVLAYWIFTRYLFSSSPAFALLAATPLALIVTWLIAPVYSRLFYRWTRATPA